MQGLLNPEAILDAAGYLCAVALIGGLEGFVLDPDEVAQDFALTRDLRYPEASLIRALESRLFRTEQGRVVPVHRTIAEFLAARYLRERVESELPIERLLRLVTGHDGGTLSDLRGLYAWLGSLVTQHGFSSSSKRSRSPHLLRRSRAAPTISEGDSVTVLASKVSDKISYASFRIPIAPAGLVNWP